MDDKLDFDEDEFSDLEIEEEEDILDIEEDDEASPASKSKDKSDDDDVFDCEEADEVSQVSESDEENDDEDEGLAEFDCIWCEKPMQLDLGTSALAVKCPACATVLLLNRDDKNNIAKLSLAPDPPKDLGFLKTILGGFFLIGVVAAYFFYIGPWIHFRGVLKEAEAGKVNAQMEVALLYERGKGTSQDFERAIHWYSQAAQRGELKAWFLFYGAVAKKRDMAVDHVDFELEKRSSTEPGYEMDPVAWPFLQEHSERGSGIASLQIANIYADLEFRNYTEVKKYFAEAERRGAVKYLDEHYDATGKREREAKGLDAVIQLLGITALRARNTVNAN